VAEVGLDRPQPQRLVAILLSAVVAHTAWHWMIDRAEVLWKMQWPRPTIVGVTTLAFWLAGILLAARDRESEP